LQSKGVFSSKDFTPLFFQQTAIEDNNATPEKSWFFSIGFLSKFGSLKSIKVRSVFKGTSQHYFPKYKVSETSSYICFTNKR